MVDFFANREWFALAAAIFLVAAIVGLFSAFRSCNDAVEKGRSLVAFFLQSVAWLVLSVALFERGSESGNLPVSNIFEIFQSLGWLAMFSVVFLRVVWSLRIPVVFGAGSAGLLCVLGLVNAGRWDLVVVPGAPLASVPWINVHVAFATVGYACFSAAAMVWFIYLLQNSALRQRRTHRFFSRLPDLASLDRIAGRLSAAGLVIFGAGVVVGVSVLITGGILGSALAIYKAFLSIAIFTSFFVALFLRRKNKISATKFSRLGVGIFVGAIILLGGTALFLRSGTPLSLHEDAPKTQQSGESEQR